MTRKKKHISMRVDEDLWELAGAILPCSRREFFEKQLVSYINSSDELEILKKEVEELERELIIKKEKIKNIEAIRKNNSKNQSKINKAMNTVINIILANGCITKQQIKYIANNNDLLTIVLEEEIKNRNYKII